MIELIAFDLDGTLTQHRTKINNENTKLLNELSKKYKLVMIAAGSCKRVYDQMNEYPINIVGNYGMQESTIENGKFKLIRNDTYKVDKKQIIEWVTKIRNNTGYTQYTGETVEFHDSGLITFPLLGTNANIEDKLKFDPTGEKRSKIFSYVSETFLNYNCFIGGSSSFDIAKNCYDKYKALKYYCQRNKISLDKTLFIGDDFKRGGNDEPIKTNGINFIQVINYSSLGKQLKEFGVI